MLVTLDDVTLDTRGWTEHAHTVVDRSWYDASHDPVRVRLFDQPCPESSVEGWRVRARRECAAAGGVVLTFDDVAVDGAPAYRGVFKYRATRVVPNLPPTSLAVYVVGMIAVPLGDWFLQINTEALERGTTGAREAIYSLMRPPAAVPREAVQITSIDELLEDRHERLVHVFPSDAEEHDHLAPTHPLSRVRASQRSIIASTRLGPALRALLE